MASKPNITLLQYWVKRLRLDDWTIKLIDNCSPEDFVTPGGKSGECEWQEVNKSAVIRILDPKFYGTRVLPFDYEKILVHELLHCKFSLLEESDDTIHDRIVHQLIEELSRALVEAKNYKEASK